MMMLARLRTFSLIAHQDFLVPTITGIVTFFAVGLGIIALHLVVITGYWIDDLSVHFTVISQEEDSAPPQDVLLDLWPRGAWQDSPPGMKIVTAQNLTDSQDNLASDLPEVIEITTRNPLDTETARALIAEHHPELAVYDNQAWIEDLTRWRLLGIRIALVTVMAGSLAIFFLVGIATSSFIHLHTPLLELLFIMGTPTWAIAHDLCGSLARRCWVGLMIGWLASCVALLLLADQLPPLPFLAGQAPFSLGLLALSGVMLIPVALLAAGLGWLMIRWKIRQMDHYG